MTLTDSGPLIALANQRDPNHKRCLAALPTLHSPMVTTWACLTEAMYVLHRDLGWKGQRSLWNLVENRSLLLEHVEETWVPQIISLMDRYCDRPMDVADATLFVMAGERGFTRIFSVDSDFHIYRLANGLTLEVVP